MAWGTSASIPRKPAGAVAKMASGRFLTGAATASPIQIINTFSGRAPPA
jgi:hypothetical protein